MNAPVPPPPADRSQARDPQVERLLRGSVDLHCHSGPSVMDRGLNHVEAIRDAEAVGMRAILFKDHYYSVTPVVALLDQILDTPVKLLSGVPLNNQVGGFNPYAVDHGLILGARLIWMPTLCAANHVRHGHQSKLPPPKIPPRKATGLTVLDDRGHLKDEVKDILDQIAAWDAVLSSGHLHISEIWPLFEEAKARGVKRLLVNHPTFVIGASLDDVRQLAGMGAYLEHSACMWVESFTKQFAPDELKALIDAGGIDNTLLGSDLGQRLNPHPVEGFREVIRIVLDLGYSEDEVRKLVGLNAARLMGLDAQDGEGSRPAAVPAHAH